MCAPVIHGTGFIPHPSKPSVLPPSPLGRLPFGKLGYPSFVFFGFAEKSTFPSGKAALRESFFYKNVIFFFYIIIIIINLILTFLKKGIII